MKNLNSALRSNGGHGDLSLTLPTSYWYLRHFDFNALDKSVDYFNYMSYDLGSRYATTIAPFIRDFSFLGIFKTVFVLNTNPYRDKQGNKWTGEFLDAHTNLTEIQNAMDLLWRNNISGDKVNLGTAFLLSSFHRR